MDKKDDKPWLALYKWRREFWRDFDHPPSSLEDYFSDRSKAGAIKRMHRLAAMKPQGNA